MIFTDEHKQLRATVRRIVERDINPHCDAWEEAEQFPAHQLFPLLGKEGLLGITRSTDCGGQGLDWSFALVLAEELGRCRSAGVALGIGVQTDMCTPALDRFGSPELKREYLAPAIAGEYVGCIGVSEPQAGSDVAAIKTVARRDGGDYVVSGTKMWITNGMQADWMCTLCNTSDEGGPHGNKSLIVIPMNARGVERSRKLKKLGMWASDTAQIHLDEVRVPARNLIGSEGGGFLYQMLQFQEERLWGAANACGFLDQVMAATIEYTRERRVFGKAVIDNQSVQFRLAELAVELEALRALVYQATEQLVRGDNVTRLATMAKLKAGRLAREITDSCLQYWGGMGFMWETTVSRAYRDARLVSIGGGADEVMLGILAKIDELRGPRGAR